MPIERKSTEYCCSAYACPKLLAIFDHKPYRPVQADSDFAMEQHECHVKRNRSLFWDDQFLGVECCQDTLFIGDPWYGGHKQVSL